MDSDISHTQNGQVDPAGEQVADVYARALVGAAENAGQTEAVLAQLGSLISDVLDVYPEFEKVLSSSLVAPEDKTGIIDRTLGQRASTLLANFLKVLAAHGRLAHVRAIHRSALRMLDQLRGRMRVDVASAVPLTEELAGRIKQQVRGMFGGEPILVREVNPDLIGGVVLRVGDTVFDGSVATRLARARAQMINRSVHEIQRRRDRFSHPAGN